MDLVEDLAITTLVLPKLPGSAIVKVLVDEKTMLTLLKEYQLPDNIRGKTDIHSLVCYSL